MGRYYHTIFSHYILWLSILVPEGPKNITTKSVKLWYVR
jgi:hypothetical protein